MAFSPACGEVCFPCSCPSGKCPRLLAENLSHNPCAAVPSEPHCSLQAALSKWMSHRTEVLPLLHVLSVWISLLWFPVWQRKSRAKGVSAACKGMYPAAPIWLSWGWEAFSSNTLPLCYTHSFSTTEYPHYLNHANTKL